MSAKLITTKRAATAALLLPTLLMGACQIVPPSQMAAVRASAAPPQITPTPTPAFAMNETPTPAPEPASTDAVPSQADLVGHWSMDTAFYYDLAADGAFSMTIGNAVGETPQRTGQWLIQDDGTVELTSDDESIMTARVFGEVLLVSVGDTRGDTQSFLRKLGPDRKPLPVVTASSNTALPLFDAAATTQVLFNLNWTGYSPLAPIVNQSALTLTNGTYEGMAHLEAAGYRDGISDTVAISVPASVMTPFLTALASTPVVSEPYRPYFSHTDDYPSLEIRVQTGGHTIVFSTTSQGPTHIPWAITVDGQQYVSYSDDIAIALAEVQPFLARDAQEKLLDKVRAGGA